MSYVERLNAFNQWLECNYLPGNAQLMFYKLLYVFNRAGWPEMVRIDANRLMLMIDAETKKTVYRARDKLVEAGWITYEKGKKGSPTIFRLVDTQIRCNHYTKNDTKNDTKSDTKNDTKSDTHIKTKDLEKENTPTEYKRKNFAPPTVDEVRAYCEQRHNGIDPEAFVAFYASKGWMVGKNKMKDWKMAVVTWERQRKPEEVKKPRVYL